LTKTLESAHEPAGSKDRAEALLHGARPRHSSRVLAIQIALGLLIGFVEGWSLGDAVYFTFVTGLTIGYGDIVPRQALARALAIGIGISGLFLTGLIAGIAVYAMRTALVDHSTD
jgi:hypothetical protein